MNVRLTRVKLRVHGWVWGCKCAGLLLVFHTDIYVPIRMVKMFGPTDVTDTYGYRCSENKKFTDADAYTDVLGLDIDVTDTDVYRRLWFTDAYVEMMLMHKVWMTEIPRFRQEIPRFQELRRSQSLNMRISSGQTYRPYNYMCRYRCLPMFWSTNVYRCRCLPVFWSTDVFRCILLRCLRLTDTSDIYVSKLYMPW